MAALILAFVSEYPRGFHLADVPVPDSGYTRHELGLNELSVVQQSGDIASGVTDGSTAVHDQ